MTKSGPPGREAAGFRDLPPRSGGGSERGIPLLGESACGTNKNAPSRSRLRPAHPIDLRRSDCRAGEPSTFGAPCSVHSETYRPIWPSSSTLATNCVANCDNRVGIRILDAVAIANASAFSGCARPVRAEIRAQDSASAEFCLRTNASAPRRWLLRPTSQLTAAEATACRRAINLRRSVLGAHGTLRPVSPPVKWEPIREIRSLRPFPYRQHKIASRRLCSI